MYFSPNMNLEIWDLEDDDFDYSVLAANQRLIDQHDHSAGKGVQINGGTGIASGSITQAQLAQNAVGTPQLQQDSVGNQQLAPAAVEAFNLAPGSVAYPAIPAGAITAQLLDPTLIPLGFVTTWWRPPGTATLPGGYWEIMDGRAWNTITNAWGLTNGNIPDMRGAFARGADINGVVAPGIGMAGGSNTANLAHSHSVNAHTHLVPAHNHSISTDGSHWHQWFGGHDFYSRQNAFVQGLTIRDAAGVQRQNFAMSTMIGPPSPEPGNIFAWVSDLDSDAKLVTNMDPNGSHSHGGGTGFTSQFATTSNGGTTDSQLGSTSIVPQNTALLYIMRVR